MRDVDDLEPPIVTAEEFHRRSEANLHERAKDAHVAFYSSWTDCITTDPSAFYLPMDDHMAHRGHGVFDTAHLHDGHLHMLDRHVKRFFRSMEAANVPPPFPLEKVKRLILRTAAAGGPGFKNGQMRFYASAGPGGFGLDQSECVRSVFYCVALRKSSVDAASAAPPVGLAAVTSTVPIKPPRFATVKSTNYLPNALVVADAKRRGADVGIWRTEDDAHVAEGPSMNVGFIVRRPNESNGTLETRFLTPPWDETLAGCTAARLCEMVDENQFAKVGVRGPAIIEPVTIREAQNCVEFVLIGSVINCAPVVSWDGKPIRAGSVGPFAVAARDALLRDFENDQERVRVPYEVFDPPGGMKPGGRA